MELTKNFNFSIKLEEKKTLSEKIYDKLKKLIMEGELEKGTKITETAIAKIFDVSPTPVREAFKKLSSEGLIEITSWKGVIVKGIDHKDLLEIYECREALESMAGKLAVQNITENDIQILEHILEECDQTNEIKKIIELNTIFHNEILRISANERLKKLLNDLTSVILYDRDISNRYLIRRYEIQKEHIEILEALKEKNADKSSKLISQHIRNGYNFIKKLK